MNIYLDKIKPLFSKSKLDDAELERNIPLPKGIIYDWNTGRTKSYKKYISEIANYFNVSTDYLLGKTENPSPQTIDEQLEGVDFALWGEVKELTDGQKKDVLNYIKFRKQQGKD